MTADFNQLANFAETLFVDGFSRIGYGEFTVATDLLTLHFASLPGDPAVVLVRARVLGMEDVHRPEDFAKAVLAGNFFWGGTRGATLSVCEDGGLYITERRFADELAGADGMESCVDDFTETATDWRERSELYA